MRTGLALGLTVLANSAGDLFLTRGMKQVGEVSALRPRQMLGLVRRAMVNPMLWLGLSCVAIAFFVFLALLSWADLSVVLPATSIGYALSTLGARYILEERVTTTRWVGTAFVCTGVALIALSSGGR